jgi:antitoxin component HigA of HigAB toxin-antitoxin module
MARKKLGEAQSEPRLPNTALEKQNAIIRGAMARYNLKNKDLTKLIGISPQVIVNCFNGYTSWWNHIYAMYQHEVLTDEDIIAFFQIKD